MSGDLLKGEVKIAIEVEDERHELIDGIVPMS